MNVRRLNHGSLVLLVLIFSLPHLFLSCDSSPPRDETTANVPSGTEEKRPNVLFVFYDQLRADVLGAYGGGENITTPNMDRLAREGMLFTNGLSTTPICTPYRGMLVTGRYPTHTGIMLNFLETNPGLRGFAEVFRDGGYRTAFMGKWHLASGSHKEAWVGEPEGSWDHARPYIEENPHFNFVPPGGSRLGFVDWAAYNFHVDFLAAPYYRDEPEELVMEGFESDALTTMAIEYMDESRRAGEAFFLMLAPHPPHTPYGSLPEGYLEKVPETLHWSDNVPTEARAGDNTRDARGYYAMCKNADDNVGRLLDYLESSGLEQDTLFVFTSDHGEMMGSHGRRNKMVPYAEAVRVPLMMRWPGRIAANSRTDTLYTPMDHMPTVSSLVGLESPPDVDGLDLSPELLGQGKSERDAVLMSNYSAHWDYFMTGSQKGAGWPEWRGVKTKRYTYVRWLAGEIELYDDENDPHQLSNLAQDPAHGPTVQDLEQQLKELLAEAHDDFLPGNEYVEWVDRERNVIRTGLGPVSNSRE